MDKEVQTFTFPETQDFYVRWNHVIKLCQPNSKGNQMVKTMSAKQLI